MCASVQSGFAFRIISEVFCVWIVSVFVKAYALLLWMQKIVIRHIVAVISMLNSNVILCQYLVSSAAWITLLYFVQGMLSCCSRMRAQCRLWLMLASRRMESYTSVCPVLPSKTNRSVGSTNTAICLRHDFPRRICAYMWMNLCVTGPDPPMEPERQRFCDGWISASGPKENHLCRRCPSPTTCRYPSFFCLSFYPRLLLSPEKLTMECL